MLAPMLATWSERYRGVYIHPRALYTNMTHRLIYFLAKVILGGNKNYVQIRKLRRLRLTLSLLGNKRPNRRHGYGWP